MQAREWMSEALGVAVRVMALLRKAESAVHVSDGRRTEPAIRQP